MIKHESSHRTGRLLQLPRALSAIFALVIFLLFIPGSSIVYGGNAKYIILFVADGWGIKHIEATNDYTGAVPPYQRVNRVSRFFTTGLLGMLSWLS